MFLPLHDRNPIRHIRFPYITYALIALNAAVFVLELSLPGSGIDMAAVYFGMIPVAVRDLVPAPLPWLPGWTTFFTYAFLHADWMHLLFNMLFLWIFGDNIEDAFGHVRFLIFYLLCAALSASAFLIMTPDVNGPLIGASGAVAGVMGAYVMLYPFARVFVLARIVIPIPLPLPAVWMLGVWAVTQIVYAVIDSGASVAWWAHVGGLAAGIVLAPLFKRRSVPLFGGH